MLETVLVNPMDKTVNGSKDTFHKDIIYILYSEPDFDVRSKAQSKASCSDNSKFLIGAKVTIEDHYATDAGYINPYGIDEGILFTFEKAYNDYSRIERLVFPQNINTIFLGDESYSPYQLIGHGNDDIESIEQLRDLASILNKNNKLLRSVKRANSSTAVSQDVSISQVPSWAKATVHSTKDGFSIDIQSESPSRLFSNEKKFIKISNKYQYLLASIDFERSFPISITHKAGMSETIDVTYYDTDILFAEIQRLESLPTGYIRLTSNEKNVDIYVDGSKMGVISSRPVVAKLTEGVHRITAKKNLYGSKSIDVTIQADDAFAYHFDLKPSGNLAEQMGSGQIVQSTGELVVLSSRNDLAVYFEGVKRIPPFKLPNIASGGYVLTIKGPGVNRQMPIEINPNRKLVINLDETDF